MYLQTVKIIISYEGGERVNHAILMSSGAENIDFMIHGIVQYEIFGHKVWITTSHVCMFDRPVSCNGKRHHKKNNNQYADM